LRDYSSAQLRTHFLGLPFMYGGTQDELRLYVAYDVLNGLLADPARVTTAQMKNYFTVYYGFDPKRPPGSAQAWTNTDYQQIINEYFPDGVATASQLGSLFSDYTPVAGLNNCAALKAAATFSSLSGVVYQWEFADPDAPVLGVGIAPGLNPRMELGAVHSSELNYVFPNLSNTSAINAPDLPAGSQALANTLTKAWTAFVRTGSPQTEVTPGWQPYQASAPARVMRFAPDQVAPYNARARHRCAFWEQMDANLASP
jgi:para-nitrobenzyl esterase